MVEQNLLGVRRKHHLTIRRKLFPLERLIRRNFIGAAKLETLTTYQTYLNVLLRLIESFLHRIETETYNDVFFSSPKDDRNRLIDYSYPVQGYSH